MAKLNLTFCCLQEVKYRGIGSKLIVLDSGEEYQYYWCGMKKKREAGVGLLIKCTKDISIDGPTYQDPRIMCFNLKLYGFSIRLAHQRRQEEVVIKKMNSIDLYRNCARRRKSIRSLSS